MHLHGDPFLTGKWPSPPTDPSEPPETTSPQDHTRRTRHLSAPIPQSAQQTRHPPVTFTVSSTVNSPSLSRAESSRRPFASNFLTVDTLKSPASRSPSDNALVSPGQLQGIVIESLKTPTNGPGESKFGDTTNTNGLCGSNGNSVNTFDMFGGTKFEPEDSEQRGIPWMLYRQRSQSAGAAQPSSSTPRIISSISTIATPAAPLMATGAEVSRHTPHRSRSASTDGGSTLGTTPSQQHVYRMAGSLGQENPTVYTNYQTNPAVAEIRSTHSSPHPPLKQSVRHLDQNLSHSTYRNRVLDINSSQQLQQQDQYLEYDRQSYATTGVKNHVSVLSVSTENFHTREAETDKTTTPHPSSHHIRRVQQLRHMHMGAMGGVVMQSSSPSLASAMTLSPALSARSVSTLVSQSSTMTDMTAVSGSSHASDYMTSTSPYRYNISSPFEAQSPGASTLYNPTSERQPQRPRGAYTFFQSFLGPVSTNTLSNNSSRSMYETPQRHSTLKESSFRKRRRYYGKSSSTRSTPLSSSLYYISGLSDRQTRKRARGIDGKAFFSNERTYMHWIKFGLLLGSMALTLLSFGESVGLNVGLFLVLITMSTLIYATAVFHTRHRWMIQLRQDVRYYDRLGPSLLFVALFLAYATNVILTMNKITDDYDDDEGFNFYNSRHLDA